MKAIIKTTLLVFISSISFGQSSGSFKAQQLKYSRVKEAYTQKWADLDAELKAKNITSSSLEVFIRIFKKEKELELWLKNKVDNKYVLFKKIKICASSGDLGPKRKEGDYQVPEGIYNIQSFNPFSSYHLALKIGYPNKSDQILKTGTRAGGDIMIHGNCVTIGCVPLQDDPIKEVYILCVESKNNNSSPRVEVYPCRFSTENVKFLKENYDEIKNTFWTSLKSAYDYFETNKTLAKYRIDTKGQYVFND